VNPAIADDAAMFVAAPRHQNLYSGSPLPRRPNYGKVSEGQPALKRTVARGLGMTSDNTIIARARMMKAVDESLGRILTSLEKSRQLAETVVIFTSDHGYFYGEHGLGPERRLAYEESVRIPLLVRYPRLFPAGSRPAKFALSVDVAATTLALAGVQPAQPLHGRPLHSGKPRDAILLEYFSDSVFPNVRNMGYKAIRTNQWKYIRYEDLRDSDDVYNLRKTRMR
jgi:N-acetylglucosamine-6-sulfatase